MIEKIIEKSVENRVMVLAMAVLVSLAGLYAVYQTPVDAIPDLSDVQVIVYSSFNGQSPQIVEDQVTYPLATTMLSVPKAKDVRGYSFFGFSMIYIIFEEGTDLYWARSRVLESLNGASAALPENVTPKLGPDATGVGWVYEYVLESDGTQDLQQLRAIQDWFLKYELTTVAGVSEVASIGGFVKEYQVVVNPNKLQGLNIPLTKLHEAIQKNNRDVGGRLLEMGETEFMVRGLGYLHSAKDLELIQIGHKEDKTPLFLKDVATVQTGPQLRRGIAEWNGKGETVGGIVVMRSGENAREVIERVKEKLEQLKAGLPDGVEIKMAYDRSLLINRATRNLTQKLLEESLIVALVIILFLLHFRSAMVAIIILPLSLLAAFLVMNQQGLTANIMSLGGIAIAIGAMVDAVIVMIENAHKHLEGNTELGAKERWQRILIASKEVGPALFYSLIIITLSFIPVFALEQQAGKMFKPLAFTKTYTMAAAAVAAITVVPVLMGFFIKGKIYSEKKHPVSRFLIAGYKPLILWVLNNKKATLVITLFTLIVSIVPMRKIGTEFMPPLNEGDILYMPTTAPGISAGKAKELLQQTDKIIASFPEVKHVFGKIGRAETATDPAPLSMIETTIALKEKSEWRPGMTYKKLVQELNSAIQFPGLINAWTMPIKTRIDMLSTGIKTPLGIKIMGPDLETLNLLAMQIEKVVKHNAPTAAVFTERVTGANYLDIKIDAELAAQYGLSTGAINTVVSMALGGHKVGTMLEGRERYPITLRYNRDFREQLAAIKNVKIINNKGAHIPLSMVAQIELHKGPPVIKSENARRTAWLYIEPDSGDLTGWVKDMEQKIAHAVTFPAGYNLVWSGQYENIEKAQKQLSVLVPVTLFIIFFLLYSNFKNMTESLLIMLSLPFALVGGVWLLYWAGYNYSVAVVVGFIALAGIAAETGIVMLLYINKAYKERLKNNTMHTIKDLSEAIMYGAVERVRPKLMTVFTTIAGLLPIMWGSGAGSQMMKRIAAPMVGGLVSSTILTLFVIPVLFYIIKQRELKREAG